MTTDNRTPGQAGDIGHDYRMPVPSILDIARENGVAGEPGEQVYLDLVAGEGTDYGDLRTAAARIQDSLQVGVGFKIGVSSSGFAPMETRDDQSTTLGDILRSSAGGQVAEVVMYFPIGSSPDRVSRVLTRIEEVHGVVVTPRLREE